MSVNPGFAGQAFIPYALDKARRLTALRAERRARFEIAMDGGLDRDNIRQAAAAGVEVAVVGSGIFAAPEPLQAIAELRARARSESV
jgi:ribulose-phosphate 3-epimerase